MIVLGYALAALVGLSLGLMGGGGSILTVPIFVYILGFDAKLAVAMSLPVVGLTSLVGAINHWKNGNVNLRMAATFGLIAMGGAYLGARLAVFVSGAFQLILLAIVMLAAAASMFRSAVKASRRQTSTVEVEREMSFALLVPVAISVGILTGLVGIGGGFLVVPALVILGRTSMKQAVGTSLLVIAMNSASGFAGYANRVTVPWGFVAGFAAIAIVGILVGSYLVRFVSQAALKKGFAVFLVLMGALILYQNRAVML